MTRAFDTRAFDTRAFDRRCLLRSAAGLSVTLLSGAALSAPAQSPGTQSPRSAPRAAWINFEFMVTWERMNYLQEVVTGLADRNINDITLSISSVGGDTGAAISTCNFLRSAGVKLTTYNVGNCYSAAVILFLAGDRRVGTASSQFLIHPPTSGGTSSSMSAADLSDRAESLQLDVDRLRDIMVSRSRMTRQQAEAMLSKTSFLGPQKALELGLVTEIADLTRPPSAELITLSLSTQHSPQASPSPNPAPSGAH